MGLAAVILAPRVGGVVGDFSTHLFDLCIKVLTSVPRTATSLPGCIWPLLLLGLSLSITSSRKASLPQSLLPPSLPHLLWVSCSGVICVHSSGKELST